MAGPMCRLVREVDVPDIVNLLDESGLCLTGVAPRGWIPKSAEMLPGGVVGPVIEVLPLWVYGDDHDDVASLTQPLDDMAYHATIYRGNRTLDASVWLYAQLNDETGERRALVRALDWQWDSEHYSGDMVDSKPQIKLGIEREGAWERTATRTGYQNASISGAASLYDYTGGGSPHDVVGNLSARIEEFKIHPVNPDHLGRVWAGIRSVNRVTAPGNFEPIWECEDGTLGTDAALSTDGTASPGGGGNTKVIVTPGTATWAKRLSINLSDITVNYSDQFGMMQRLLRCRLSAADTWEVKLHYGYADMDDGDFVEGPIREVSSTTWDYIEMGVKSIPLRDFRFSETLMDDSSEKNHEIQVWARRTGSGSSALHLDCINPIPVDEGYLFSWGFDAVYVSENAYFVFGEMPLNRKTQCVIFRSTGGIGHVVPHEAWNFRLPPGDGRIVMVLAQEDTSDLTDQWVVDYCIYYECWRALRGGE